MKRIIIGCIVIFFIVVSYLYITALRGGYTSIDEGDIIVYETEVSDESECSSHEAYDRARKVCYFECSNQQSCDVIQKSIESELALWVNDEEEDTRNMVENTSVRDENMLSTYIVQKGELLTHATGEDDQIHRALWQEVAALSPDTLSDDSIESFAVFSDARDDTLAFVDDADGNGMWRVTINYATHKAGTLREQKATIIHELAHIISLNQSQVESSVPCTTLALNEGCLRTASFLYPFYNAYWKGKDKQKFDENVFVTQYAATDTVEDFAETFTFFVLEKEAKDERIRDKKVSYFYRYPALIDIRTEMRKVLTRDIIRARQI